MPIRRVSGARRIRSSGSTTRAKSSTGKYVSRCQDIKDPKAICNRSQILKTDRFTNNWTSNFTNMWLLST